MKLALVEIAIAVELDPFADDFVLLSGLVRVRVGPDEPLDGLVVAAVGLADSEPLRFLVPRVFHDGDAVVDQALVLVGQEKRDRDEDQSQQ